MKRKILFCCVDESENRISAEFEDFILKCKVEGIEICVIDDFIEQSFLPHDLMSIIESKCVDLSVERLYFLSNVKELVLLMYRVYHQTFRHFIYFGDHEIPYSVGLTSVYQALLTEPIYSEEQLWKPIFMVQNNHAHVIDSFSVQQIWLNDLNMLLINDEKYPNIQKYYYLEGKYHLFEGLKGEKIKIKLSSCEELPIIQLSNVKMYCPDLQLKQAFEILQKLNCKNPIEFFKTNYELISNVFEQLKTIILESGIYRKSFYILTLELLIDESEKYKAIFILSFLRGGQFNLKPQNTNGKKSSYTW